MEYKQKIKFDVGNYPANLIALFVLPKQVSYTLICNNAIAGIQLIDEKMVNYLIFCLIKGLHRNGKHF